VSSLGTRAHIVKLILDSKYSRLAPSSVLCNKGSIFAKSVSVSLTSSGLLKLMNKLKNIPSRTSRDGF
jgi:hypothetical protein